MPITWIKNEDYYFAYQTFKVLFRDNNPYGNLLQIKTLSPYESREKQICEAPIDVNLFEEDSTLEFICQEQNIILKINEKTPLCYLQQSHFPETITHLIIKDIWPNLISVSHDNIVSLTIMGAIESLDFLHAFPNLQFLFIQDASFLRNLERIEICPLLKQLTILQAEYITNIKALSSLRGLKSLYLRDFPLLKSLSPLEDCQKLNHLSLEKFPQVSLPELPNLDFLKLENTDISNLKNLPSTLSSLFIKDCPFLKDFSVFQSLNELEYLNIDQVSKSKNIPFPSSLKKLIIQKRSDTTDFIDILPNLNTLKINNLQQLGNLNHIAQCTGLKYLSLQKTKKLQDVSGLQQLNLIELELIDCEHLQDISPLSTQATLRKLKLHRLPKLKDISPLQNLQIRELSLDRCFTLQLLTPLGSLHHLQILTFKRLPITDISFIQQLQNLSALQISQCSYLQDFTPLHRLKTLQHLLLKTTNLLKFRLSQCPRLETINLSSSPNLEALDFTHLPNVSLVNLDYCPRIETLDSISNCPQLSILTLKQNDNQNSELRVADELAKISNLQILILTNVVYLPSISFIKSHPKIRNLRISKAKYITDISALAQATQLQLLELNQCQFLADISPLKNTLNLQVLYCQGSSTSDISSLSELDKLHKVDLSGSGQLRNLSPLMHLRLQKLTLDSCHQLADISPIEKLISLKELSIKNCQSLIFLKPLQKIRHLNLLDISISNNIRDLEEIHTLHHLYQLSAPNTSATHFLLCQAAINRNDYAFISKHIHSWIPSLQYSQSPNIFLEILLQALKYLTLESQRTLLKRLLPKIRERGLQNPEQYPFDRYLLQDYFKRLFQSEPKILDLLKETLHDLSSIESIHYLPVILIAITDLPNVLESPTKEHLLEIIQNQLSEFSKKQDFVYQISPAAAVFFQYFQKDEEFESWLNYGTSYQEPNWADPINLALLEWELGRDNIPNALEHFQKITISECKEQATQQIIQYFLERDDPASLQYLSELNPSYSHKNLYSALIGNHKIYKEERNFQKILLQIQNDPQLLQELLTKHLQENVSQEDLPAYQELLQNSSPNKTVSTSFFQFCEDPFIIKTLGLLAINRIKKQLEVEAKDESLFQKKQFISYLIKEEFLSAEEALLVSQSWLGREE